MAVVNIAEEEIRDNEVLLQLNYVGFCGSDLSTYLGKNPMVKMPVIPGHEVGAMIVKKGKDVPDTLKAGMTVTVEPGLYYPGLFGIRLEYTTLIVAGGAEVL